ncbi:MAG: hypothetical protein R3C10_22635 [Pirellulales bacterium]
MPGENLDVSSQAGPPSGGKRAAADPSGDSTPGDEPRPYVGVHFACCDVYQRVYVNRDKTGYFGRCPRCLRQVRLRIGPGGTDSRFFTVS